MDRMNGCRRKAKRRQRAEARRRPPWPHDAGAARIRAARRNHGDLSKVAAGGDTCRYSYNESGQVVETDVETDTGDKVYQQFVWDPRAADTPLEMTQFSADGYATNSYFYMQDANHNVTGLVDGTGAVVERYAYDAYGNVTIYSGNSWSTTISASAVGNPILYQGMQWDAATGLYRTPNRYYSPVLQTWISRDPAGYAGSPGNLYDFCGGGPADTTDATGLAGSVDAVDVMPRPKAAKSGGPATATPPSTLSGTLIVADTVMPGTGLPPDTKLTLTLSETSHPATDARTAEMLVGGSKYSPDPYADVVLSDAFSKGLERYGGTATVGLGGTANAAPEIVIGYDGVNLAGAGSGAFNGIVVGGDVLLNGSWGKASAGVIEGYSGSTGTTTPYVSFTTAPEGVNPPNQPATIDSLTLQGTASRTSVDAYTYTAGVTYTEAIIPGASAGWTLKATFKAQDASTTDLSIALGPTATIRLGDVNLQIGIAATGFNRIGEWDVGSQIGLNGDPSKLMTSICDYISSFGSP